MKIKRARIFAWCLAFSLMLTQILFTDAAFSTERVDGSDVYKMAINIAKMGWKTSDTAIVTRGDEIADALAATPLAYAKGKAPILFTKTNQLPSEVLDELIELNVKTVYIIGGEGAVSDNVEKILAKQFGAGNVIRLGGSDRIETAMDVAKAAFPDGTKEAVISGAYTNADALSVSSIAAVRGMPILLVDNRMTDEVAEYVKGKTVYAVGGPGVLSNSAVSAAKAQRLAGDDRYETNAEILKKFDADYSKVFLSKGDDAHGAQTLAGSALAALSNSPMVLVDEANSVSAVKKVIQDKIKDETEIVAIGGTSVIPEETVSSIKETERTSSDIEVKSVSADNLKQVQIKFNAPVDDEGVKFEIEDESNYKVEDSDGDNVKDAVESVELGNDKKSAVLTLKDKDNKSPLKNQEEYTLILDEDIFGEEQSMKFTPKDTTIPKSTGAEVIGISTIKVKFSEPIRPYEVDDGVPELDKDAFEVDDGDIDIKKVELLGGNKEANITLHSELDDKQKLEVKVKSKAEDYAGYSILGGTYNLTVDKDTKGPKVTGYKNATRAKVTLVFDEDIQAAGDIDDGDIYHTNKNNSHDPDKLKISGNEMTVGFDDDDKLPSGTAYIYIKEGTMQDFWENENDDIKEEITIEEDNAKPRVENIEQGDGIDDGMTTLVVTFSEPVDEDSAEDRDNYIIENLDGDEQRISKAELTGDDEVMLTMKYDMSLGDEYEITIRNVEDLEGNKMDEYNETFTLEGSGEYDWSDVVVGLYEPGGDDQRIVVDFGRAMTTGSDAYSVDDYDKYILYIFPRNTTFPDGRPSKNYEKKLPVSEWTDSDIKAFSGDEKVEISLPFDDEDDEDTADLEEAFDDDKVVRLVIGTVADEAGNTADMAGSGYLKVEDDITSDIDILDMPKAVDTNKIEFTFEGQVDVDDDDIHVYYAKAFKDDDADEAKEPSRELSIDDFDVDEDDDGNTVVTIELDDDLNYDASYTVSRDKRSVLVVTDGDGDTESEEGEKLQDGAYIVKDGIAPKICEVRDSDDDYVDNVVAYITTNREGNKESTIVIEMEEPIDGFSLDEDTFSVEDFDIKDIYVTNDSRGADDNEAAGKYIVIKLWEDEGDSDAKVDEYFSIKQKDEFEDISGNEVEGLKTEVYDVR